jgi:hypothetical protein
LIEAGKATAAQVIEALEDIDKVLFDDVPASTKEFGGETVGPWSFTPRQSLDRVPDFLGREWLIEVSECGILLNEQREVQGDIVVDVGAQQGVIVVECSSSHVSMISERTAVVEEAVDHVLLTPVGALVMVEGGVSVAVLEEGDARADGRSSGREKRGLDRRL